MKILLAILIGSSVFCACQNISDRDTVIQKTPQALNGIETTSRIFKRSDDLVNELYAELVAQSPELQQLENKLETNRQTKEKLEQDFNQYSGKSVQYYQSAQQHVQSIQDTLLRNKIKNLIISSEEKNSAQASSLQQIVHSIENRHASIKDYYSALKIVRTLPLIEQYQKDHLPASASYKKLDQEIEQTRIEIQNKIK